MPNAGVGAYALSSGLSISSRILSVSCAWRRCAFVHLMRIAKVDVEARRDVFPPEYDRKQIGRSVWKGFIGEPVAKVIPPSCLAIPIPCRRLSGQRLRLRARGVHPQRGDDAPRSRTRLLQGHSSCTFTTYIWPYRSLGVDGISIITPTRKGVGLSQVGLARIHFSFVYFSHAICFDSSCLTLLLGVSKMHVVSPTYDRNSRIPSTLPANLV